MPSTRDIRRRIKSVKNTRQITKAMELVAASKMKKAQQLALAGQPYANLMADMLAALAAQTDESVHPFLVERPIKTRGIMLITSDKGLCGPLNANLFKLAAEIKTPVKFYTIGRKGWEEDPTLWTPFDEESAIRKGARYYISVEDKRLRHGNLELYCWLARFPLLDPNAGWPVYLTDPAKVLPGAEARWDAFRRRERAGAYANWSQEWKSQPNPCR